jgi:valyl-tRNA synthetase
MTKQRSRAAQIFENAVDSLGSATAATGSRVKKGLDKTVDAVADSGAVEQIAAKTATARKVGVKKIGDVKKAAKQRAAATAKKTAGVKKSAKKTAGVKKSAKKTAGVKKSAKKTAGVKKQTAKKTAGVKNSGGTRRA